MSISKTRLMETRLAITKSGMFDTGTLVRLSHMARAHDLGLATGDGMADRPLLTYILWSGSGSGRVHLVDDGETDGRTFCNRRATTSGDAYEHTDWASAIDRVSCPGCRAKGINRRDARGTYRPDAMTFDDIQEQNTDDDDLGF